MTEVEQRLAELEAEMNSLVRLRNERVDRAQAMMNRANRDFDKAAIPLARRINVLRDQLEAAPPQQKQYKDPDPDWTPEDIAHFHELMQR